jgi:hypothetical protein
MVSLEDVLQYMNKLIVQVSWVHEELERRVGDEIGTLEAASIKEREKEHMCIQREKRIEILELPLYHRRNERVG